MAVRRLHTGQITHNHEVDYREALMALEAGGASRDVFLRERERLALESAGYLWRALRPLAARPPPAPPCSWMRCWRWCRPRGMPNASICRPGPKRDALGH